MNRHVHLSCHKCKSRYFCRFSAWIEATEKHKKKHIKHIDDTQAKALLHYMTYAITSNGPFVFYALTPRTYAYPLSDVFHCVFHLFLFHILSFLFTRLDKQRYFGTCFSLTEFVKCYSVHWLFIDVCRSIFLDGSYRAACVSIYPFKIQWLINLMAMIFWWNT